MRVLPHSFCIQKSQHDYSIVLINIFSKILSDAGWIIFWPSQNQRKKSGGIGFYYRDNSPASSSKYQHNRNLFHCINLKYRVIHPLIRLVLNYKKSILWHSYGCIDSGPKFTNVIPKKVRFVWMLLLQYQK